MYKISHTEDYLLVKFTDDFDFPIIRTAIRHETMLREYADKNDIWLIGDNHARIYLGEIDLMVNEFQRLCPRDATRTKTAVVVNAGLTSAIMELWVHALKKLVPFEIEIFQTIEEAEDWLSDTKALTA